MPESRYASHHPWRSIPWYETSSCSGNPYFVRKPIELDRPFNLTLIFDRGRRPFPPVPAGTYRVRLKELSRNGTVEVVFRARYKKSLNSLKQAIHRLGSDAANRCSLSSHTLLLELYEHLDRETARYLATEANSTDSGRRALAWALSARPDLWKALGDSNLRDLAAETLVATRECGCMPFDKNLFRSYADTDSALSPTVSRLVRDRLVVDDGFSTIDANLVQELWPYISHRLLSQLVRAASKLDSESRSRLFRAIEGLYSKLPEYTEEDAWDFATEEARSAQFISVCPKPGAIPWQSCALTRKSQAQEFLDILPEFESNQNETREEGEALKSLKTCLKSFQNPGEADCDSHLKPRPDILDEVLPEWATEEAPGEQEVCGGEKQQSKWSLPVDTRVEIESFHVFEY